MKYFKPPFQVANIEKQYQELRQAFEVKPGMYAPGIADVDQEYEICLRLCKIMANVAPRKPLKQNFKKRPRVKQTNVINRTQIIVNPDAVIKLAEFIAKLLK